VQIGAKATAQFQFIRFTLGVRNFISDFLILLTQSDVLSADILGKLSGIICHLDERFELYDQTLGTVDDEDSSFSGSNGSTEIECSTDSLLTRHVTSPGRINLKILDGNGHVDFLIARLLLESVSCD